MCNHVDKIITTVDSFCPHELKLISLFYFSHGVFRPFVCLSLILQLLRLQLLTLNTQPSTLNNFFAHGWALMNTDLCTRCAGAGLRVKTF